MKKIKMAKNAATNVGCEASWPTFARKESAALVTEEDTFLLIDVNISWCWRVIFLVRVIFWCWMIYYEIFAEDSVN